MIKKLLSASKIITNSNFTKSEFVKYFPTYSEENVVTIHLGITLEEVEVDTFEKYLPSDWKERGYITYLGGGIQKNKNSAGVIKSYRKFLDLLLGSGVPKESLPYLLVAGKIFLNKNIEAKKLRNLVQGLNLEDNVIFSGYYDDSEKYSLLKNSRFFIHLSTYEGFGVAVGEAMRAGCAIIADKSSSYPEVVGDSAILVDGNDHEEVAAEMLKLFNDSVLAKKLGAEARERSFMFSWEKTSEQTMEVLRSVSEDI